MSRTQNIKRNLVFNIIRFLTQQVLNFVLRTVLIYFMGPEYLGLNGLFGNIFAFLNLAELGIGTAIAFAMYKPVADGDIEKVKALQNLYKKIYLVIALFVLATGGILTPFIKIFIKDELTVNINIYLLFLMYLANSFVGYFSAHKRALLLAYQRNDIEKKVGSVCNILMAVLQIVIIIVSKNYYLFFGINIIFTFVDCVLVHVMTSRLLPDISGKVLPLDTKTKKAITKDIAALSLHKVGGAVIFSTDSILVSSFFGVIVLGAYSNYALILSSLTTFFGLLITALTGSVGNLIASCDKEYVYKKFKQINFIFSFITSFCAICLFTLFQPFIKVWTGGGVYLLTNSTVLFLCISFYFTKMREGTNLFKNSAGLFWQDKWKPIVEAVVNLVASIVLVKFIGINGVFIGTIISTLIAPFWVEPKVLYKHYFNKSVWNYFRRYVLDIVITLVVACCSFLVCYFIPDGGVWLLIARFAVCGVVTLVLLTLFYCWTPEFREIFKMAKKFVKNIFRKKEDIEETNSTLSNT